MSRKKSDTLSSLGRAPARTSGRMPPYAPPSPPEPPVDRATWVRRHLRDAFLGNLGLKFLSLVLALTVFLLVNTDRDYRETPVQVPVSYLMRDDRVLVTEALSVVRVTVRGPWRRMRRFDPGEIEPIEIDLRTSQDGEIEITPDMVRVPSGLTLLSLSPRTMKVAFEKRVTRTVNITPVIAGRPEHGYVVAEVKAEPASATAGGAEGVIKALSELRTREVRVDGATASLEVETQLVPPDGVRLELSGPVTINVEIKEQLETRRLGKLTVQVIGEGIDPISVTTDPPAVEVVLTGTVRAVDAVVAAGIVPTVKVTAADANRKRSAAVVVAGVPPGVGVELVPAKIELAPVVKPRPKPPAPTTPTPSPP